MLTTGGAADREPARPCGGEPGLRLTVLSVPGCPNVALLEERLAEVISRHPGAVITRRVLSTEDEAVRWGMRGSPTLLVNGVDPFASPGQRPSLSCRRYPREGSSGDGAPSAEQIRRAIGRAGEDPG